MNGHLTESRPRARSQKRLGEIASRSGSLRVLCLAADAYGGRGGIAQSTRDLVEALAAMPEFGRIDILPRRLVEPDPVLPRRVKQHAPSQGRLFYALRALWHARSRRTDLVYCGHAFMAPLAYLAARISGARLVTHVHGLEVWFPLSGLTRRGIGASDLILCVSRYTADKVVQSLGIGPNKCATIYNTMHERFTPGDRNAARARFGVPSGARVLSTVSRLDSAQRHKGHDRVIPLLADLAREVPGLTYLIAGTGDDRDFLAGLADQHGAGALVRFLGHVPDADLPDLYRATDLYVMPSHGDGFGIAFIEAMACGTPALGLNLGGAGDALCDGVLGRAVSEADFAAVLAQMLKAPPPNRLRLAQRTREMFARPRFEARVSAVITPVLAARAHADPGVGS